jgi:lipopolysaccharide/colanic/teichoic acid biosynthesis glycosyltransferase
MKRCIDFTFAFIALILLAPLMIGIAICVLMFDGRPIFFTQQRPGISGRPFRIVKFRTMSDSRSPEGNLVSDSLRLTRFGRLLRSTSLDELPELCNVLVGDMSLVGPRPLLMEYLPLYSTEQSRRHNVRPGITGWAQVNGRNSLSWEDRFVLDVWYVDNRSFWLDIKIVLLTVLQVIRRRGINAAGEATMPRFTGSNMSESS